MKAVRDALFVMLTGNAALLALLGSPSTAPYRVYYQNPPVPPFAGVDAPMIVFWLRPATINPALPREIQSLRVDLHVNAWDRAETGPAQHEEVMRQVVSILHHVSNGAGFRAIQKGEPEDLIDEEVRAVGVHSVFDVFYRRSTL